MAATTMTEIEPERQVRRAGDPAPCKECGGGRCRLCDGWGHVNEWEHSGEGVTAVSSWGQKPCPHKCPMPAAYFFATA